MNDIRPLVLIGNGASIRDFDWSKLNGMDTMAMNAFYKVSEERGFFPTYYCLFRKYMEWGDAPSEFILNNHGMMKKCFYVKRLQDGYEGYPELEGIDNVVPIIRRSSSDVPVGEFEGIEFAPSYDMDVDKAFQTLYNRMGEKEFGKFLKKNKIDDPPYELNTNGMVKWYSGAKPEEFSEKDIETRLRWEPAYEWVRSLDDFCTCGEPSGVECARIASLLGYNVILMIGFDGNFKLDKDGNVLPESWGITEPFNGFPFNAYEHTKCMSCKTEEGIRNANNMFWFKFQTAVKLNGIRLAVFNCTKNTDLEAVDRRDFDKMFSKMMSFTSSPKP